MDQIVVRQINEIWNLVLVYEVLIVIPFKNGKVSTNCDTMCSKIVFSTCSSETEYNASRDEEPDQTDSSGFAIVINGHSLVHALHPQLEQLFLLVSKHCELNNWTMNIKN